MSLSKTRAALAAATLFVAPIAAQAVPVERTAQPTAQENELSGTALYALVAILVALGLYFAIHDGKSNPVSS